MNNVIEKNIGPVLFGYKCYHDAMIQNINGKETACYFDGKDYISLNPKDSECSFSYFRKITEEPIYIDTGACNPTIGKMKEGYRFVYFSKEEKNIDSIILLFQKEFEEDPSITIKNINRDENKLLKYECGINDADIKLKKWTYFSIDFQLYYKYNNCLISDCL